MIEINTLLKTFESSAEITGSKNQELLQEYISFNRKFNDQNLSLMQKFYQAQIDQNNKLADSLQYKTEMLATGMYNHFQLIMTRAELYEYFRNR